MPRYCGFCFKQGHDEAHCRIKNPNFKNDGMNRHKPDQSTGMATASGVDAAGHGSQRPDLGLGVITVAEEQKIPTDEGETRREGVPKGPEQQHVASSEEIVGGEGKGGADGVVIREGEIGREGNEDVEGEDGGDKRASSNKEAVGLVTREGNEEVEGDGNEDVEGEAGGDKMARSKNEAIGLVVLRDKEGAVGEGDNSLSSADREVQALAEMEETASSPIGLIDWQHLELEVEPNC